MLVFALANAAHAELNAPAWIRFCGQLIVGMALGLYFTAPVVERLVSLSGWILLSTALSLGAGLVAAYGLMRIARLDATTAFFAGTVGGAVEMANQAERHGARVDQVAASQVTRVLAVVLLLPVVFQLAALHGDDTYHAVAAPFRLPALSMLLFASIALGLIAWRGGVPNAWLFAPLALSAGLSATGHPASAVPVWLVDLGQWLIGCSLGTRFAPKSFEGAPRLLWGVLASASALVILCAAIGVLIGLLAGIPWPTLVLATAPGGIAEMGLTAKLLGLGVPVVTAFHIVRLTVVVVSAGPLFRMLKSLEKRRT